MGLDIKKINNDFYINSNSQILKSDVISELEERLNKRNINKSDTFLWTNRKQRLATISSSYFPPAEKVAEWTDENCQDYFCSYVHAIDKARRMRNKFGAHALDVDIDKLYHVDVLNVQSLLRELILKTTGTYNIGNE